MTPPPPRATVRWRLGTVAIVLLAMLGASSFGGLLYARLFMFQNYSIASASMLPTLQIGDFVLVSKIAYQDVAPARGDIVIVRVPLKGEIWIKRVIGVAGDRVQMKDGAIWLNGKPLRRDKVGTRTEGNNQAIVYREILPEGRSYRALDLGVSELDNTRPFVVPASKYFVLGDNLDNSDDSRMTLAYVDRSDIVGKVIRRYFSPARGFEFTPVE